MTDNQQRAAEVLGFRELEQARRFARDDLERVAAALDEATVRGYNAGWDAGLARGRVEALRTAADEWARGDGLAYWDGQAHEFLRDRADGLDGR